MSSFVAKFAPNLGAREGGEKYKYLELATVDRFDQTQNTSSSTSSITVGNRMHNNGQPIDLEHGAGLGGFDDDLFDDKELYELARTTYGSARFAKLPVEATVVLPSESWKFSSSKKKT